MNFNSLFFPSPKDRYTCVSYFGDMFYLPKYINTDSGAKIKWEEGCNKEPVYIPCLMIQQKSIKAKVASPHTRSSPHLD